MAENEKVTEVQADKAVKKKEKKPGFFSKAGKWLHDLVAEAKRVVWPTGNQVVKNTIIVIILVIIVSILVWILDSVFGFVRDTVFNLLDSII